MTQTTDRLAEVLDWTEADIELLNVIHDLSDTDDFNQDSAAACLRAVARHRIAATQSLSADLAKAQQRIAELEGDNVRLRAVVLKYADDLCEYSTCNEGCGKFDELTCGGCFARAALNQPKETSDEG